MDTRRNADGCYAAGLPGVARRRTSFFARAKKEVKESTPRFAALRVPSLEQMPRAAA